MSQGDCPLHGRYYGRCETCVDNQRKSEARRGLDALRRDQDELAKILARLRAETADEAIAKINLIYQERDDALEGLQIASKLVRDAREMLRKLMGFSP